MREDIPEWLGKPPRRGTDAWEAWLEKWRAYARAELNDATADDPDLDFGLLTVEERWRVTLAAAIRQHLDIGRAGGPCPFLPNRGINDHLHACIVAWLVGRSAFTTEPSDRATMAEDWVAKRANPRRRRLAHAIRYGFLAGLGAEATEPDSTSADYVAAYEAAWEVGNAMAIEVDPR